MEMFDFTTSIQTFSFFSWYGLLTRKNKKILQRIVETAGSNLDNLSTLYETSILRKAQSILADPSHPLYESLKTPPKCRTERFRSSFVPFVNNRVKKKK